MVRDTFYSNLIRKIGIIVESEKANESKLETICRLLKNNIPEYDWVGFYIVDRDKEKELVLGPYIGEITTHTRIKFGDGVCGQVADTQKTLIIDDVREESNYLSCSLKVHSEIVVPIFKNNSFIGEIDIDSHTIAAFTEKDEEFLNQIGKLAVDLL